jgi:hypothetical protein
LDGFGRGGRPVGRPDRGEASCRRTEALGCDLHLDLGPLLARCTQLSLLSIVKPRACLCRRSRLNPSGRSGRRLPRQARALAVAEPGTDHHFGLRGRLDHRDLRVTACIPHLVTEQGLLLRYGVLGEAWIPWRDIAQVVKEPLVSTGGMDGLSAKGGIATLAAGGKTAVTIRRRSPGVVKGFLRGAAGISQIRVAADDPDAFLAAITAGTPHGTG